MLRHGVDFRLVVVLTALACLAGCGGSSSGQPANGGAGTDGGSSGAAGTPSGAAGTSGASGSAAGTSGNADAASDSAAAGASGNPDAAAGASGNPDGASGNPDAAADTAAASGGGGSAGGGGAGAGGVSGAAGGFQPPTTSLVFDVSTASDPAAPGGRLLYTVTVGNVSTLAVAGVTVSMTVPAGLQFGNGADALPGSSNCHGSSNLCVPGDEVSWALGSLAAGASRSISINAQVLQTVGNGDSIAATFKLVATGVNPTLVTKTVQVHALSSAELATGTSVNPVTAGQRFTLDLDVGQVGTAALTGTVLSATVAPGLTVASISDGGTQAASGTVSWNLGGLGIGASVHRTIDVTVDSNVTAGAVLATRATLTYDGGLAVDAAADYAIRVAAATPSISLKAATTSSPAVPAGRLVYTATVRNLSTRAVDGVTVLFRVPNGLQFGNAADAAPNSSNCNGSSNLCPAGYQVSWALGSIPAGDSRSIEVNAQVLADEVGNGNLIRAVFAVLGTGIDELDAVKTVQIFDKPGAQLTLTTTANPVTNTKAFTYAVDIGQIGTVALTGAALHLALPAGLTVGAISNGGARDASGIAWTLGGIAVGAALHLTVDVTCDGTALPGTPLSARATLTYDGGDEVDALTDYTVSVVAVAQPLSLAISASPNPVSPGNRLLYAVTVTNTTARSVAAVQLLVRVPTGTQFGNAADADPNSSNCNGSSNLCVAGDEAAWDLGDMAAGASQIITINTQVLTSMLKGSLIPFPFWLTATGLDAPLLRRIVVPAQ
jgi:uncharacterized repeat protein (TIGR01451 family)